MAGALLMGSLPLLAPAAATVPAAPLVYCPLIVVLLPAAAVVVVTIVD
jgi:hypothetical protein